MYAPIRPALYLNFLKPPLHPLIAFARASAGYRVNEKGLLESVSSGLPRFGHWPFDGVAGRNGAARGLLVEETRTNLILRSQELDNAAWGVTRASISANATTAPDGTATADKIVEDSTASNTHRAIQGSLNLTSAEHCFSLRAKAGERSQVNFVCNDAVAERGAMFDLSLGTVLSTGTGVAAWINPLGNGWHACNFRRTLSATASGSISIYLATGGSASYSGDGASGLYAWGVEASVGGFATAYIPTTSATVTRAAETASVALSSVPGFNAAQGTLFAEWVWPGDQPTGVAGKHIAVLHDGSNSNAIKLLTNGGSNEYAVRVSGSEVAAGNAGAPTANAVTRSAVAWDTDNFLAATQGTVFGADTAGAVPGGLTTLQIGGRDSGTEPMNGYIRQVALFPRRFTQAELQRLTI